MKLKYLLLSISTLIWAGCHSALADLITTPVSYQMVADDILLDGVVEASKQSTASAQTAGQVIAVNYDVHDIVERDAVILRLTDKKQRAERDQANASLKEAGSHLREAKNELARMKGIYAKKLASQAQMDRATTAYQTSKARVDAAKAQLVQAQEQLDFTVVSAPWAGIMQERHVELGEFVNVGQPLMTGISLEELRVEVKVPQRLASQVKSSEYSNVLLDDGRVFKSSDILFFPQAIAASSSFRVRINLPQTVDKLFPGMFVKVSFAGQPTRQLLVDAKAVMYRSELTAVYVSTKSGLRLRQIKTGRQFAEKMVVLAGLQAGENVVIDPVAAGIQLKTLESKLNTESAE